MQLCRGGYFDHGGGARRAGRIRGAADRMRNEIANRTGMPVGRVLLHCIHTHSAPRTGGSSTLEGGTNYNYASRSLQAVIDCAVRTILDGKGYRPFRLEVGKGTTSINGNRSV